MDDTPKPRRRRASLGRLGDVGLPGMETLLKVKVQDLLAQATASRVHIEYVENGSFETEFVLSADSMTDNARNAIMRLQKKCLGPGWTIFSARRRLPVAIPGLPATMSDDTWTLVVQYKSRAIEGWSFPRTLCSAGTGILVLCLLVYFVYWLIFVLRK